MQNFREILIQRRNELDAIIANAEKQLKKPPQGRLEIVKQGEHFRYYVCDGTKRRYLHKNEECVAAYIAQYDYSRKMQRYAMKEKAQIDRLIDECSFNELENMYENLSLGRKKLVEPLLISDKEYVVRWKNSTDEQLNTIPIQSEIYSENNEHVRSKSEKIIADKLFAMEIPYKYEAPLKIRDRIIFPDFTILKVKTREIVYWEHLGMMDNAGYLEKAADKLDFYERNGIIPGKNLILTHETKQRPLNIKVLDYIIDEILK
ncbi:MAG: hypothetical protein ACI4GD_11230 [Lachnospiraceae bacterium]